MAEYSSQIAVRPAGRGWPRWLAALLVGLLLLLTLLIASWFLRACAPVDPSLNLTAFETPAAPAPPPPIDPTLALKASLDDAQAADPFSGRLPPVPDLEVHVIAPLEDEQHHSGEPGTQHQKGGQDRRAAHDDREIHHEREKARAQPGGKEPDRHVLGGQDDADRLELVLEQIVPLLPQAVTTAPMMMDVATPRPACRSGSLL
jgi:hypothetical protein